MRYPLSLPATTPFTHTQALKANIRRKTVLTDELQQKEYCMKKTSCILLAFAVAIRPMISQQLRPDPDRTMYETVRKKYRTMYKLNHVEPR